MGRSRLEEERRRLLDEIRERLGNARVLRAMEQVERSYFVPASSAGLAYEDIALPIGEGQTISQPYIVALMVDALGLRPMDRVLEIGTGSGYQAAVLARMAGEVVTVERLPSLARSARLRLDDTGRVQRFGARLRARSWDGLRKLPTTRLSSRRRLPSCPEGSWTSSSSGEGLWCPSGPGRSQELMKVVRTSDGFSVRTMGGCRFVPLIGPDAWPDDGAHGAGT